MTSIIVWNWSLFHLLRRIGVGDAGSVDSKRQRAEFGLGARDGIIQSRATGHIGGDLDAAATCPRNEIGGVGKTIIGSPVEQRNIGTALCEPHRDALADAAASTRHDRDISREIEQFRRVELDFRHKAFPLQIVASSITETSFASSRFRIPACFPWAMTMMRPDTPSTSSRSELTTITATPSRARLMMRS